MLRVWEATRCGQGTARKQLVASASRVALCLALFLPAIATPAHAANAQFDLVIVHGRIIDGTGSPWYSGDIGIRNGRIAAIGKLDRQSRIPISPERSEEHTSELQSQSNLVCRLLLEKKKNRTSRMPTLQS